MSEEPISLYGEHLPVEDWEVEWMKELKAQHPEDECWDSCMWSRLFIDFMELRAVEKLFNQLLPDNDPGEQIAISQHEGRWGVKFLTTFEGTRTLPFGSGNSLREALEKLKAARERGSNSP